MRGRESGLISATSPNWLVLLFLSQVTVYNFVCFTSWRFGGMVQRILWLLEAAVVTHVKHRSCFSVKRTFPVAKRTTYLFFSPAISSFTNLPPHFQPPFSIFIAWELCMMMSCMLQARWVWQTGKHQKDLNKMKICFLLEKMDQHCECKHPYTSERGIWTPRVSLSFFGTGQLWERLSLDGDRGAARSSGGPKVRRS